MGATLTQETPAAAAENWLDDRTLKRIRQRAGWLCRQFGFRSTDREDIEQHLNLAILQRARNADPRVPGRPALVERMLKQATQDLIRSRLREMRAYHRDARSLSELVPDGDGRLVPLAEMILPEDLERRTGRRSRTAVDSATLSKDVQAAIARLPRPLQRLCMQALDSGDMDQIPPEGLAALREYFAAAGLDDYLRGEE